MKVGNMVKWSGDQSSPPLVGMVIDTCMIGGLPHASVFWFDLKEKNHHPYMDLTTISRA
jgi:hypothetical protein|tara:strand:- start:107 stop:283 length:177 start_codon:yes stop_codon:yes gene_type:complete